MEQSCLYIWIRLAYNYRCTKYRAYLRSTLEEFRNSPRYTTLHFIVYLISALFKFLHFITME